jgi:predicted nucleic acid-binding protein
VILPDANLLMAFTWENHQHHVASENFFQKYPKVATCPLTELALVRIWMQKGASGSDADRALKDFVSKYRSRLIPDDLSATAIAGQTKVIAKQQIPTWLCLPNITESNLQHLKKPWQRDFRKSRCG